MLWCTKWPDHFCSVPMAIGMCPISNSARVCILYTHRYKCTLILPLYWNQWCTHHWVFHVLGSSLQIRRPVFHWLLWMWRQNMVVALVQWWEGRTTCLQKVKQYRVRTLIPRWQPTVRFLWLRQYLFSYTQFEIITDKIGCTFIV